MAKARPYRLRDPAGKAHSFATRKALEAYRDIHGGRLTRRPLPLRDGRDKNLARQYQAVLRARGEKKTLRQLANDKTFRGLLRDLRQAKTARERYDLLGKIMGRKAFPVGGIRGKAVSR